MATPSTTDRHGISGVRTLLGATVIALAVLGGAVWQLHPGGTTPRLNAASSEAAINNRAVGGQAELIQFRAQAVAATSPAETTGAGSAAAAGPVVAQRPAVHAQSSADNPIIGAWTTHAVSSTAGIQANLLAFLPGGILIHSASNFPQSAGIGAWYDAGDGTVVYTFIYRRMDKSGAYIGSTHVHARVTVAADGLTYDSPLYTELTDPDDNVTSTGQGTSHATRLLATPPPGSDTQGAASWSSACSASTLIGAFSIC